MAAFATEIWGTAGAAILNEAMPSKIRGAKRSNMVARAAILWAMQYWLL